MNKSVEVYTQAHRCLRRLLCVLFAFVAVQMQVWSADDTYQGVALTKPTWNEATSRYLIKNRAELLWWAVNDQNKDIRLEADINVQDEGKHLLAADGRTLAMSEDEIVVWPCLYYRASRLTIEGNNHTISGIYQNRGYGVNGKRGKYKKYDRVGFISYSATKTVITDLNIADAYICGKYAGGFIGYKMPDGVNVRTTELKNNSFRGFVKADWYGGGFVGWHRTDGEDLNLYRCINYGTIEAGGPDITDYEPSGTDFVDNIATMAAGGIIGYLDIKHTPVLQISTNFNRCVNYGSISCMTERGNAGGIVGHVWDNNNGKRQWDFCYNFGKVTNAEYGNGASIVGCYRLNNGSVTPKFRWCGASKNEGASTIVNYVWKEYGSNTSNSVLYVANKTCYTRERLTALQENIRSVTNWFIFDDPDARARNFFNNYKLVTLANVVSGTSNIGNEERVNNIAAKYYEAQNNASFDYAFPSNYALFRFKPIDKEPVLSNSAALTPIPASGYGELYNSIRSESNAADVMQAHSLIYTEDDLRNGRFAYDANLAMQADVLDGKANTDKSLLFVQHLDMDNSALSDTLPAIAYEGKNNADKLYWGHYHCFQETSVSNDANAGTEPSEHKYDDNGVCQYCHASMQPLDLVIDYTSTGAERRYYAIKNQSQLRYFAAAINDNYDGMRLAYFKREIRLVNDIEFSPNVTWIPINTPSVDPSQNRWYGFCGTFDGQGHTISGLRTADNSTYAGLFAYASSRTPMCVKNLKLSNCVFKGRYAGSIIGQIDGTVNNPLYLSSYSSPDNRPVIFDHIAVDNTVEVVPTNTESNAAAGGLVGALSRVNNSNLDIAFSNCYSNARITCLQQQANRVGNYVGYYSNQEPSEKNQTSTKPLFDHCYFGGTATCELNPMGTTEGTDEISYKLFNESYNVGNNAKTTADGTLPIDITRSYLEKGYMAYDLMRQSKQTDASGKTHYYFAQEGRCAVLTDTIVPTLSKLQVATPYGDVALGDTIINLLTERPLQLPFSYAGQSFKHAMLLGWKSDNQDEDPVYTSDLADGYSGLRTMPDLYFTLLVDGNDASDVLNINKEEEWKGAGVVAGNKQTNVMATQLVLGGLNAWSLPQAPEVIDGHYNTIVAQQPLVSEKATSTARAARAARTLSDVTIKNVRVRTDVLTENVLSNGNRHLNIENAILQPLYGTDSRTWFDLNSEANHTENTEGVNLNNVVGQAADSTSIIFYQNGTSLQRTNFSDANKNNDYAHILDYMLAQDGFFSTFGIRLDTVDVKVAGKFGFATDDGKRIYRAKVYNQATGAKVGEVLMNNDAVATFSVEGNRVIASHKGLPEGTFAVLQQTRDELGADFKNLAANVITKDGHTTCLCIDERVTEGFAYPEGLASNIDISANSVKYIRQVRRDGAFEDIYLPFSFTTIEFDEQEFSDPADQIEICFMQPKEGDVINNDGKVDFTSVGAYKQKKFSESVDIDTDTDFEVSDEVAVACVPYLIRFDGQDRTDEKTTVTFSCNGGCLVYRNAEQYDENFFGVFNNSLVSQLVNGKKVYRLESAVNEQTGKSYSRFVRANGNDVIDAFHCYMSTNSPLAGDVINIAVDGSLATGISGVKSNAVKGNGQLYDITGRRVNKMIPHNVYIKNGKKIVRF